MSVSIILFIMFDSDSPVNTFLQGIGAEREEREPVVYTHTDIVYIAIRKPTIHQA